MILISENCTANCSHCPFKANGDFKTLEQINQAFLNLPSGEFSVITGGEPFEHKDFEQILFLMSKYENILFRVATGGHVPLSKFIPSILKTPNLSGISMGTDVISPRNNNREYSSIYEKNISILNENKINYSITITLGPGLNNKDILNIFNKFMLYPKYFLIQISDGCSVVA
jgi:MoaA/NifB/PqqE/SkfB family radical SAM enzyme